MGTYDVAQICRNGHLINEMASRHPEKNEDFCTRCGEPTITACEACKTPINGRYLAPGVFGYALPGKKPAYCRSCGEPFPWTVTSLVAAKELAATFEDLDEAEKGELQQSLEDLTRDTPQTKVAESKFKRLIKKAGTDAYDGMRSILVDVVSETVKKSLFGA